MQPWFVFRPSQIARRILQKARTSSENEVHCTTAWGGSLWCKPNKVIGRSIHAWGIFDIVVSEVLARLLAPGATFVDAGANVGYMTVLGASFIGTHGTVIAFEPNVEVLTLLNRNADLLARNPRCASIRVVAAALGATAGSATLYAPSDYMGNEGIAHMVGVAGERALGEVPVTTLDAEMGVNLRVDVLKMDVEGFELEVLKGAEALLASRRITHIVFEDHAAETSPVLPYLVARGYQIYRLGYTLWGPDVTAWSGPRRPRTDGSPSYLATRSPPDVIRALMRPRGWRVLRRMS